MDEDAGPADGRPITLAVFTISGEKIAAIDIIDHPSVSLKPTWPSSTGRQADRRWPGPERGYSGGCASFREFSKQ
jgi:hypothetical protein